MNTNTESMTSPVAGLWLNANPREKSVDLLPYSNTRNERVGTPEFPFRSMTAHSYPGPSDRRLKENIKYIDEERYAVQSNGAYVSGINSKDCYDFVKQDLNLAVYNFIATGPSVLKIGFIAQEIENTKVGKLLININDYGERLRSFDSGNFSSIIAGAVKTNIKETERLKEENLVKDKKIKELEDKNKELENRLKIIEEFINKQIPQEDKN